MRLDLVVFDIAGTVLWDGDNAVAACLSGAMRDAGVAVTEEDVNPVMGMFKPDAIRRLFLQHGGRAAGDAQVATILADFHERIVSHYRTNPNVREIDGALRVFRGLRERGILVGLDTGFDRIVLDAILDRMSWRAEIDATIGSDEVPRGRPAPDMIFALMQRLHIDEAARVGKVGDSVSDLDQGLAAGCGWVGAIQSPRTTPVLDRYPSVARLGSVADMEPLLTGWTGKRLVPPAGGGAPQNGTQSPDTTSGERLLAERGA